MPSLVHRGKQAKSKIGFRQPGSDPDVVAAEAGRERVRRAILATTFKVVPELSRDHLTELPLSIHRICAGEERVIGSGLGDDLAHHGNQAGA